VEGLYPAPAPEDEELWLPDGYLDPEDDDDPDPEEDPDNADSSEDAESVAAEAEL